MLMEIVSNYTYDGQVIELQAGDSVHLGERTASDDDYPNWIHCQSNKTGKTGWVPAGILTIDGDTAVVTENYTSEEMSVSAGEIVDTIYELNGWYWCKRISDEKEAWIAKNNLKPRTI